MDRGTFLSAEILENPKAGGGESLIVVNQMRESGVHQRKPLGLSVIAADRNVPRATKSIASTAGSELPRSDV